MTANEKIARMLKIIEDGGTVYISTMTRVTKIDKKAVDRFAKLGAVLFKAKNDNMYMAAGNKFVCIDGCKITATK